MRAIIQRESGRAGEISLILLNPNASDLLPLRKWETARFVELGRRLLAENPSLCLIITGAPSEQASAETVAALASGKMCSLNPGVGNWLPIVALVT